MLCRGHNVYLGGAVWKVPYETAISRIQSPLHAHAFSVPRSLLVPLKSLLAQDQGENMYALTRMRTKIRSYSWESIFVFGWKNWRDFCQNFRCNIFNLFSFSIDGSTYICFGFKYRKSLTRDLRNPDILLLILLLFFFCTNVLLT